MLNKRITTRHLAVLTGAALTVTLTGCWHDCPYEDADIVYSWEIPESQADCPSGTEYRDSATAASGILDGGASIVDRDGGATIVDRDGNPVKQHCYRPCADGEMPVGKTIVDWQHNGDFVVGYQICTAGEGDE